MNGKKGVVLREIDNITRNNSRVLGEGGKDRLSLGENGGGSRLSLGAYADKGPRHLLTLNLLINLIWMSKKLTT
jgi:hypothetical protein